MKFKSRKTLWIVGIPALLLIAVGFVMLQSSDRVSIEYVEKLGCTVTRKNLLPWQLWICLPKQLRSFIPKGSVYSISFPFESRATDTDIERILRDFPNLFRLELSGTMVTDEGVRLLSKSRSLTEVSLDGTEISDEAITHLSKMTQLRQLSVQATRLTDKSVDLLCQMPNLYFLDFKGTQISRDGKQRLRDNIQIIFF